MDDIRFDSLEKIQDSLLHSAFMEAFSDYAVSVSMSLSDMRAMHARRGISYAASLGAFSGDSLVGFIFNGDGTWHGLRCAYDGGTGVVPSCRGQGLTRLMVAESARRLRTMGFQAWLLEVLVGNEKAIKPYKAAGFTVTRRFSCMEGVLSPSAAHGCPFEIASLDRFDPSLHAPLRDWEPSWQNSDDSILRSPEPPLMLGAHELGRPGALLGYVIATRTGSIYQLAVRKDARGQGIGALLLSSLAAAVPGGSLRYINIQNDDEEGLRFLESRGLCHTVDQWEMALSLA